MFKLSLIVLISAGLALHFHAHELKFLVQLLLGCALLLFMASVSVSSVASIVPPSTLRRGSLWVTAAALLLASHHINIEHKIGKQLPPDIEGQTLQVIGKVTSLPERDGDYVRFELLAQPSETPVNSYNRVEGLLRLSWKTERELKSGEVWRLSVRLKRPRGFTNPKGFDYQAWLLSKGIVATGYVYRNQAEKLTQNFSLGYLSTVRQRVSQRLERLLVDVDQAQIIKALLIGDRSGIDDDTWQRFRNTGTIHLMAISGLHVGLVAGFFAGASSFVLRPCVLVLPLVYVRVCVASISVFAAFFYAILAGFSVPTQRALGCVMIVHLLLLFERRSALLPLLALLAGFAICSNPFLLLQSGFLLSFAAVGVLLYAFLNQKSQRRAVSANLGRFLYAQWALLLGLLPVMSFLQLPSALVAPLANSIAVPLVSFAILPLAFLGLMLSAISDALAIDVFRLSGDLLAILDRFLAVVENVSASMPAHKRLIKTLTGFDLLVLTIAALMVLSPRALRIRSLGLLLLLPLLSHLVIKRHDIENEIVILDSGQGLASVVKGKHGTLIYDIGARYSDSFSIAKKVLSPYLDTHIYAPVKYLVLSHADNDHAGDAPYFVEYLNEQQTSAFEVISGEPEKLQGLSAQLCTSGKTILGRKLAQDITIDVLWPAQYGEKAIDSEPTHSKPLHLKTRRSNNHSCVLLMNFSGKVILFSGDIEKSVEYELVQSGVLPKKIDLLVAPHHGSLTSSTSALLNWLEPKHIVISAGFRNRYRHPSDKVLARYYALGADVWNTAHHGALSIKVVNNELSVRAERCENRRRWYQQEQNCETGSSQ